ncbi:MAG TPA: xanthine dehydrogenase family protein molybdopterin-binding subunit [Chloroflexota bacterium]|nr:xanthine dehydrogenase family protein molybdopterin-binding subunit [Chloroflexota bacterium]
MAALVGRPIRRVEDPRLVSGRGAYVEDIQPAGLLYLAFVRSPYPAARIVSVDIGPAREVDGVVAVLTAADIAHVGDIPSAPLPFAKRPPHRPLAKERVIQIGQAVACIAAESPSLARDAADLVEVEYEPLASVASAEAALEPDAPRVHADLEDNVCYRLEREGGDVERAFAAADTVVRVRVNNPRVAPVAMEPRGIVVVPDESGGLTAWVSTQAPHGARGDLARAVGLAVDKLRVLAPDVGGAFGAKSGASPEYVLACHLALRHNRPVKWVASRSEDMQVTTQGRDMVLYVELAAERDGTLTGLKVRQIANMGANLYSVTAVTGMFILSMASGCYRIPNVRAESLTVFTNTPSTGPYRGAGRPEAVLGIERGIDAVARELGMDPLEVRRKNFIAPDQFPYNNALGAEYDSGDYGRALAQALELANYPELVRQRDAARARGELMGIGFSTFVEPSGSPGGETGRVRVEADGKITLVTGSQSHGQGHETSFAQVVADEMQVPLDQVRVVHGDTAEIPSGTGTFASRSLSLGGGAALDAGRQVIDKAASVAAHLLEVTVDDVKHVQGGFEVAGAPARRVTWQEIAQHANGALDVFAHYDPAGEMWPFGTHLAVVRIDRDTGLVRVEQIVAVDDCGNVVNPLIVDGQVQGGIAQAYGCALCEQVVFDSSGQMLTGSLGDYAVARGGDIPSLVLGHTTTPTPLNPLGAKGVGEAGTNGCPPAIANAVLDALSPLGITDLDLPYTSARVWEAIQKSTD